MKDYKPFKIRPNTAPKKNEKYSPEISHPGQFLSHYTHQYSGNQLPACEGKKIVDEFR